MAGYLVDLLTRFARTDQLFPAGVAVPRLEAIVDVLLEAQAAWDEASPHFSPEREMSARRHLGDYALFMTGVFSERVERLASTAYYVRQGQRAYRFVSEHDRASSGRRPPRADRCSRGSPIASSAMPGRSTTRAASTSARRPLIRSSGSASTLAVPFKV